MKFESALRKFFNHMRASGLLGERLEQSEVDGCMALIDASRRARLSWAETAYVLATAYHETAHTMLPVREAYWLTDEQAERYFTRMYDVQGLKPERARRHGNTKPGDGPMYCGRGYVQLTWKSNYARAQAELSVPLVQRPDLALKPDIAAEIIVRGMRDGWFMPYSLKDFIHGADAAPRTAFVRARRIVNGTDKAADIADYAAVFQEALRDLYST